MTYTKRDRAADILAMILVGFGVVLVFVAIFKSTGMIRGRVVGTWMLASVFLALGTALKLKVRQVVRTLGDGAVEPGLALASVVGLIAAMELFAFHMSPRGAKIGGCIAAMGVLAAVLAVGTATIALLLPRESKASRSTRRVAVMTLVIAGVMIAANGIPLLIALLRGNL